MSFVLLAGGSTRVHNATVSALAGKAHVEHSGKTDLLTAKSMPVEAKV